ncbi:hypothetical protein [Pseudoalteromonas sp. C8]|uniref:hypothetical protein n=1 Tax=Pseudoalteromonas sp. C8 TaxID=2686345 RepID=UPI0013FD9CC6|nr:hypothetical protein [Pseudoalteromonas sp. C8]
MKNIKCGMCERYINITDLASHMHKKHGWIFVDDSPEAKAVNALEAEKISRPKYRAIPKTKRKKVLPESLRTCPHCALVLESKPKLVVHIKKCPKKGVVVGKLGNASNSKSHTYEWALIQKLPKGSQTLVEELSVTKELSALEKEITFLANKTIKDTKSINTPVLERLIVFAHAKRRTLQRNNSEKAKNKKQAAKGKDIFNMRGVVLSGGGGPGTGKRR